MTTSKNYDDDRDCNCDERFYNGRRLPKPLYFKYHNCAYIRQRNSFIPDAMRSATSTNKDGNPVFNTALFSAELDRLTFRAR